MTARREADELQQALEAGSGVAGVLSPLVDLANTLAEVPIAAPSNASQARMDARFAAALVGRRSRPHVAPLRRFSLQLAAGLLALATFGGAAAAQAGVSPLGVAGRALDALGAIIEDVGGLFGGPLDPAPGAPEAPLDDTAATPSVRPASPTRAPTVPGTATESSPPELATTPISQPRLQPGAPEHPATSKTPSPAGPNLAIPPTATPPAPSAPAVQPSATRTPAPPSTPTPTHTPTRTPTPTVTPAATLTATPTPQWTPAASPTPAATPSAPPSPTPSSSPTATPSPTPPPTPPPDLRAFQAGAAGTVTLLVSDDWLVVYATSPQPGWTVMIDKAEGQDVQVKFLNGPLTVQFWASIEEGVIDIHVEESGP